MNDLHFSDAWFTCHSSRSTRKDGTGRYQGEVTKTFLLLLLDLFVSTFVTTSIVLAVMFSFLFLATCIPTAVPVPSFNKHEYLSNAFRTASQDQQQEKQANTNTQTKGVSLRCLQHLLRNICCQVNFTNWCIIPFMIHYFLGFRVHFSILFEFTSLHSTSIRNFSPKNCSISVSPVP